MARELQVLTEQQAQHFIEKGYVRVKGCLDRELAKSWTDEAYGRLGYAARWTRFITRQRSAR